MYGVFFFQIEALLSRSEKCMVTPVFCFGYKRHLLSSALRKNIPVLVGTTHRKPGYLEIRRTYAQ